MHKIIASGSTGNSVIYFDKIMVDCGLPFSAIKRYIGDIKVILLTHTHGDHLNLSTIKRISLERPSMRFACGDFMAERLEGVGNVDILKPGVLYDYGLFKVSPIILYHDVPNFGYRIFKGSKKIIHATDTYTLEGISAKNYDLYALECNYDESRIHDIIIEKQSRGEYAHQKGSINSHLSKQQAQQFVLDNAGSNYEFIMLHQSSEF